MSTLTRYVNRIVLVRLLVVLLAAAGFAILFDLLDVGNRVIRRTGGDPTLALARYALIRLPTLLTDMLPLVTLVAGLLGVVELLRSRELVVMWGAGLSRLGLVLRLWPLALLLVAGKFVLDDVAVPRSVPELRALRIGEFRLDRGIGGEELWLRSGPDIIRIPTLSILTGDLSDISIFARDSDGLLIERVEAASARHVEGGWLLQDVLRRPAAAAPFTAEPELFWPMAVDLAHVELMAKMPRELGWSELRAAVAADGWGIGTIDGQRTWLHGRITMALAPALTLALGFAVARRFARVGGILPVFASGLALGFGYTILNGLLLAMGELGLLHAVVAAWTTPLLTVLVILGLCGALPELRAPRRPGRLVAPRAG